MRPGLPGLAKSAKRFSKIPAESEAVFDLRKEFGIFFDHFFAAENGEVILLKDFVQDFCFAANFLQITAEDSFAFVLQLRQAKPFIVPGDGQISLKSRGTGTIKIGNGPDDKTAQFFAGKMNMT